MSNDKTIERFRFTRCTRTHGCCRCANIIQVKERVLILESLCMEEGKLVPFHKQYYCQPCEIFVNEVPDDE